MHRMKTLEQLQFDNSYARLPDLFWSAHQPSPLDHSFLIHFNEQAAGLIGLDPQQAQRPDFVDIITAKTPLPGYQPVALCYAGHQFGHYVPRLGDGRAILLGEIKTDTNAKWDLQLKGAGQTLYSRGGDGRAVLRSTIREYLCSEAMHGLGIPTTRALCMTGSCEEVYRERIEAGAMLLRMAPSHVRFGSFEYFYYNNRFDDLRTLADYVLQQHYPHLQEASNPYLALLEEAVRRTAQLIAQWQAVGFSHGVMNTDNMSILGLTLDYGPYGFFDQYQPDFICNHSDHQGRYAFNRQPDIGLFNVSCLAQALLPLIDKQPEHSAEIATEALRAYEPQFKTHFAELMRGKLGLREARENDEYLWNDLFSNMEQNQVDYTLLFRALSEADPDLRTRKARGLFLDRSSCDAWLKAYHARLRSEGRNTTERSIHMKRSNPKYILRNYIAEFAIRKAEDDADFSEIDTLMRLLQNPYEEQPEFEHYAGHPPAWAEGIEVSCSS